MFFFAISLSHSEWLQTRASMLLLHLQPKPTPAASPKKHILTRACVYWRRSFFPSIFIVQVCSFKCSLLSLSLSLEAFSSFRRKFVRYAVLCAPVQIANRLYRLFAFILLHPSNMWLLARCALWIKRKCRPTKSKRKNWVREDGGKKNCRLWFPFDLEKVTLLRPLLSNYISCKNSGKSALKSPKVRVRLSTEHNRTFKINFWVC